MSTLAKFDLTDKKKERLALIVLLILHGVGLVGLLTPFRPWIVALTPVHLVISTLLVLWGIGYKSPGFKWWFMLVILIGYSVELAGIKTGVIFGNYQYGETLGFKWMDVPVIIGLNWFLVSFGSFSLVSMIKYDLPVFLRIILAALLCVGLDIFIEPIAIQLDYWQWDGDIPLRNFIGWFAVSLIIQTIAFYGVKPSLKPHKLGVAIWLIQLVFFVLLNVLLT